MQINVTKSSMPPYEEYCNEIKDIWDSHWLTNMGKKHQKLQKALEEYLNVKHVVLYTNGHLALENAISLYEFPAGSEIITTPFTFASTTHAIVRNNCVPVFCDIKEDDYTIDSDLIEDLITDKTVAILPVHVYGNICDVDAIRKIADKYNLKVIYDAAHAFGEKYKGISVGNFGDISMFSFHATKVFNTIEGGCLCFNEDCFVEPLNDNKNFGIRGPEDVVFVGGNAKMNEFQAAMGLCNLKYVDSEIAKRKDAFRTYIDFLSGIEGIKLPVIDKDTVANYSYFPVLFEDYKYSRDEVFERLNNKGIISRKYFYPLTSDFECYKHIKSFVPQAKKIANDVLTLPLYGYLKDKIIDTICKIIME